ncbi:Baculoviral IAP repeat-containing protein 6 [Aphelenchoides fujianensis]|nr:Baculoviral IAP repeat-containing protein 6 [Aphelenchoides fujianensis]
MALGNTPDVSVDEILKKLPKFDSAMQIDSSTSIYDMLRQIEALRPNEQYSTRIEVHARRLVPAPAPKPLTVRAQKAVRRTPSPDCVLRAHADFAAAASSSPFTLKVGNAPLKKRRVNDAFQMLQARGIHFETAESAPSAGDSTTQANKPPTSAAAFAALQYEPAMFDGMSNEIFSSAANKPPKTSNEPQVYSYALSMDDECDAGPTSSFAAPGFSSGTSAPVYLPPPSTLLQLTNDSTAKSEIFGQISSQLADFASKVQGMQSSLQNDTGGYVLKLPVSIPLKRLSTYRAATASSPTDGSLEYTLIALSLFLEIDSYGETLRLVDGLQPLLPQSLLGGTSADSHPTGNDEREDIVRSLAGRLTDRLTATGADSRNESEQERLMLVPFLVLSRCFENANPSRMTGENAERIRLEALENGTMDVILTLLSHYGHQKPARTPIRPNGDLVVAQLISRLIAFASDVQSVVGLFNAAAKPNQRRQSGATGGASHASQSSAGQFGSFTGVGGGFGSQATGSATNDGQFWAKGTGFGSGNTTTQWNLAGHVAKRKQHEVTVTCLLNILSNFIKRQSIAATDRLVQNLEVEAKVDAKSGAKIVPKAPKTPLVSTFDEPSPFTAVPLDFVITLQRSCLNATLNSYMMNDSVLDISRHVVVYESVVGLILAICSSAPLAQPADRPAALDHMSDLILETDDSSGCSVYDRLKKLCGCVEIYMNKLTITADSAGQQEENLGDLLEVAQQAMAVMTQRDQIRRDRYRERFDKIENEERMEEQRRRAVVPDANGFITGQPLELAYNEVMRPLQFESIRFFGEDGTTPLFPYLYSSNLAASSSGVAAKRIRRLAQEIVTLSTSLPLSLSSSVFLRTADERLDVLKVLITGPADTPYSGGCFEFDVSFPENYPLTPMNMNLQTTGNRTVRFNPNLYEEGKVCLSVLNTWNGRPEERWNAETSSFLQVLVSIQSLIFVNEPYFNEPGFERSRGTPAGDQSSRDYTANIRHQCIRWAMLEMLRTPPAAFFDVIRRHFWLKRDEICLQIQGWIARRASSWRKTRWSSRCPST